MTFDKFNIRPIQQNDERDYFNLVESNRQRISKYFPVTTRENKNLRGTSAHIANRVQRAQRREYITYVVVDGSRQQVIGTVFLKDIEWNIPKCELGFFIDEKYEGKGITSGCIKTVVEHCFKEFKMNKLFMRIAEDNKASRRVAEKNGFVVEGILRKDFKTAEGILIDAVYYGLLNGELI